MEKVKYTLPEIEVIQITDDFIIATSGWNWDDSGEDIDGEEID